MVIEWYCNDVALKWYCNEVALEWYCDGVVLEWYCNGLDMRSSGSTYIDMQLDVISTRYNISTI